jgi:hypothetical protein
MSLVLDGTNGLSDVDGSAATPAIRGTDTNTGIFFPAADTIAFAEGGAEVARFDSSGNLGLGVTPSAWSGFKAFDIGANGCISADGGGLFLPNNAYDSTGSGGWRYKKAASTPATLYLQQAGGSHAWYNAASGTAGNAISFTQAMTLDTSGNLLVGSTTTQNGNKLYIQSSNFMVGINGTNATGEMIRFYSNGSTAGTIAYTATTVAYNTSSDYRLKHDITPMTGALAKVAQLKPVTYKWNADDSQSQGFIAHELQAVVPECVTGEKDAVDAEGNPQYQGIDTSFLVATLTAAIQELKAIVDAQGAEIAALKGTQP